MAVDNRYKRGSATSLLVPSMTPLAQPNTNGVDQLERQAIAWMYSGILADSPPGASGMAGHYYRMLMQGDII